MSVNYSIWALADCVREAIMPYPPPSIIAMLPTATRFDRVSSTRVLCGLRLKVDLTGALTKGKSSTRRNASHSAIVIEVGADSATLYALTIGGNESDSIRQTVVRLTPTGPAARE